MLASHRHKACTAAGRAAYTLAQQGLPARRVLVLLQASPAECILFLLFRQEERSTIQPDEAQQEMDGCAIGGATGNAVADGGPISWKNRDDQRGTYGILTIGYGSPFDPRMGVNDAGLSLQNAFCENMSGVDEYADFKLFALSQVGSNAELRQAIIEDTSGSVNYWDSQPAICAGFSDAQGRYSMFELQQMTVSGLTCYEYHPTSPLRLGQFPRKPR